jgi:molecular chaperone GrpE
MTQDDEAPRRRGQDPRDEGDDEDTGTGAGGDGDDEDIEILEVSATDDAGVRLPEPEVEVSMDEELAPDPPSRSRDEATGEIATLRSQVGELREQLLRTAADFDNFRKRTERDRIEERKQASAGVVRSLLPVLDSFRRAVAQAEGVKDNAALSGFVDGVKLIESQLFDILKSAGLEPVETDGRFDPSHHEALMQEHAPGAPHLSILEVFEPGYRLGGRLLRPARVKVANNPAGEASGDAGEDGG